MMAQMQDMRKESLEARRETIEARKVQKLSKPYRFQQIF